MLQLQHISILQYKNYQQASFDFPGRIVGIYGKNGAGKTNLLDVIYYLCFTKSYFTKSDAQNVRTGSQGLRIAGRFDHNDDEADIVCIIRENGKKEFSRDGEAYEKMSAHIGKFPCVIIAPDDVQIITGGSEERRSFIDALVSQLDQAYLQNLIGYNKVLQQRNSLLKSFADNRRVDNSLLEVLNDQLIHYGNPVFEKRKKFLQDFIPLVQSFYKKISGENYDIIITYESQLLNSSMNDLFKQYREKDLLLQRTNTGIHKDDISFLLQGSVFKIIASQGQRKSLLFALKLAAFEVLKNENGFAPLLLLDDVFEKLDELRMQNLLEFVCVQNEGQVFITDTHRERLERHLSELSVPFQLIEITSE